MLGCGCGKETKAPAADAGPVSTISYGPAVLNRQSCPALSDAERLPTSHVPGCDACKPDEFCDQYSVRGRQVGSCMKSQCQKDDDCAPPPALCVCGPPNKCRVGNCRTPGDCGGRDCVGTLCRTKDDTCRVNTDCGDGNECAWNGKKFACQKQPPPPPPG
jgi:hypothetical protein